MNKQDHIFRQLMEEPTRHWHFEELLKAAGISRPQTNNWLKKLNNEGLITRTKLKGRMPYYSANYENPDYQIKKRLFALNWLERTGFLRHLATLQKAQTVILFGSMARWDWYSGSDIDLFIYGNPEGLDKGKFRKKLGKEIQAFVCRDNRDVMQLNPALLKNIVEGYIVKGRLDFVGVTANVQTR